MARGELSDVIINRQGRPVEEGSVIQIKVVAGSAGENVFYSAEEGAATKAFVTTDQNGYFSVWLTEGRYEVRGGAETKIEDVINQKSVAAGGLAAEAVTAEKIATNAVTTVKVKNEAVTKEKLSSAVQTELEEKGTIGAEAVTTEKIASNAVTAAKIKANAVETAGIKNEAVTKGKLSTEVQETLEKAVAKGIVKNEQAGNYTLVLGDVEKVVAFTKNTTESKLTVPTNASVAFPVGTYIEVMQYGSGTVKIEAAGGVTLRSPTGNHKSRAQYSTLSIYQYAVNEWVEGGDLE